MSAKPVRGRHPRDAERLRELYHAICTVRSMASSALADSATGGTDVQHRATRIVAEALYGRDSILRDLLGIPRLDPPPDPRQLDLLEGQ